MRNRSRASGRKLVRNTSARSIRRQRSARPSSVPRSMPTLRFCRPSCSTMKLRPDAPGIMPPVIRPRIGSPWRGCAILTTSAPQSPSAVPAEGTKPQSATSTTCTPSSTVAMGGNTRRWGPTASRHRSRARRAPCYARDVDAWNHNNYCVPPEHVDGLCACIEALFPWTLIVRRPHLVGYRLGDDLNRGALYLRPAPAARAVFDALARLRRSDVELGRALAALEAQEADLTDHHGIRIASVEEWEGRRTRARELARAPPELAVTVVHVERPGDAGAMTDYLYQAWVWLGLLGPWRNTFSLQGLEGGGGAQRGAVAQGGRVAPPSPAPGRFPPTPPHRRD